MFWNCVIECSSQKMGDHTGWFDVTEEKMIAKDLSFADSESEHELPHPTQSCIIRS